MRENPKVNEEQWITAYYLEWIPKSLNNGVGVKGYYSDQPIEFRYKNYQLKGNAKTEFQLLTANMSTNVESVIATRADLPFKREDYILDDLALLKNPRINGLKYKNFSRISAVIDETDSELSVNNLRGFRNDILKVITIG